MSLSRIFGVLLQEFYITKRSLEVIMDLFFFSIISVIVFGFVSLFLTQTISSKTSYYLLTGILLWEVIRIIQYTMSVEVLWNVWSKNLSNMFVAPLTLKEYIFALMLSGLAKGILTLGIVVFISATIFKFNLLDVGLLNLTLFFINLTLFSYWTGLAIIALVLRYGTRIQALSWGLIFLFQPLTAAFFPLDFLPPFLQKVALFLPPTYVFEAARNALINPIVNWQYAFISFALNIIYFALSVVFFVYMVGKSKESGQFARNEG